MAGVEYLAEQIKLDKFRVAKSASKPFLNEVYQYVWDEKSGMPKKEFDDDMDAIRYGVYNQHKKTSARIIKNTFI